MKQTTVTKKSDIKRSWFVIDASEIILGRLSTVCANILRGKDKSYYVNHLDCGDYVVIINAKKISLSGNKINNKYYYNHSKYIGGLRKRNAREMLDKYPIEMITRSIKGMLPKNKLRNLQITRLYVYEGEKHNHSAQLPMEVKI